MGLWHRSSAAAYLAVFIGVAGHASTERDVKNWKSQLLSYYTSDFSDEYARRNPHQQSNTQTYFEKLDADSIALQYQYIKANPHPLGNKDELKDVVAKLVANK